MAYKLLRRSSFNYDVVCSTSHQWGYSDVMEVTDGNLHIIPVETNDLKVWQRRAIEIFEAAHLKSPYKVVMTRSMPPEALDVGLEIKRRHPEVKWIASFGDPVGNNPCSVQSMEVTIPASDGVAVFISDLAKPFAEWSRNWTRSSNATIGIEAEFKKLQEKAMGQADVVVCPSSVQRDYMRIGCKCRRIEVIPHSFDEELYAREFCFVTGFDTDKINIVYLGYSDQRRSLLPVLRALKKLREENFRLSERICLHVYGNNPLDLADYAESFMLPKTLFEIHGNCSYWQSLAIMRQADWLLHVDAYLPRLESTGGSVFFAGKLADYMGSSKPILALTGKDSPADIIVRNYGGRSIPQGDQRTLVSTLSEIAHRKLVVTIDKEYRGFYDNRVVSSSLDSLIQHLISAKRCEPVVKETVVGEESSCPKLMTICVPVYNGEATLERCLNSLVRVKRLDDLDIIVIDDGSWDETVALAMQYVRQYAGSVRLIRKPNGGHGSGINTGIKYAKGLYFRVLDADDWVDSEALTEEIEYIGANSDCPADVCYTDYRLVDSVSGESREWPQCASIEYGRVYRFSELDVDHVYFTMAGTSFLTSVLRESGVQCQENCYYTDSEYILKPIPYVETAVFLKSQVYRYWRGQEGQSVAFSSFVRNYENHAMVVRSLIIYYQQHNGKMPEAQKRYFHRLVCEHIVTHYRIMQEFDPDKKRGRERRVQFDKYLRESALEFYLWNTLRLSTPKSLRSILKCDVRLLLFKVAKRSAKLLLPHKVLLLLKEYQDFRRS